MKISSQTYCFHCGEPTWQSGKWEVDNSFSYGAETRVKLDSCASCGAHRNHVAFMDAPRDRAYTSEYFDPAGRLCNFMTHDPRFRG